MRERAIAFDIKAERTRSMRIMVFFLVTALLVLGLLRGTAGSAELKWKFTPSSEQRETEQTAQEVSQLPPAPGASGVEANITPFHPVIPAVTKAAVNQFKATFNCETIRVGDRVYPCNMQGGDLKGFVMAVPDEKNWKTKFIPAAWRTDEENNFQRTVHGYHQCSYDRGKIFHYMTFVRQADMSGADFTDAKMCNFDFQQGFARGTKFVRAHIHGGSFRSTDLTGADFSDAVLGTAVTMKPSGRIRYVGFFDFNYADLTNVKFRGTTFNAGLNLVAAKSLAGVDFTGAKLPDGISTLAFASDTDFTGVTWFDGTVCQAGSIGKCLSPSGTDKLAELRAKDKADKERAAKKNPFGSSKTSKAPAKKKQAK